MAAINAGIGQDLLDAPADAFPPISWILL